MAADTPFEGAEITELAAHWHAATAELAQRVAAFDAAEGWAGAGIRSCAHWLGINAGLDHRTGSDLVRIGHALEALPLVATAFAEGRLSLDKVRALSLVATPADQETWVEQALHYSASQLVRVCRAVRRALLAQDPDLVESQLARRGLWESYTEDGMLQIRALLPPDQGELVLTALRAVTGDWLPKPNPDDPLPDPALDRWAAQKSDALAAICEHGLATAPAELMGSPESRKLVVHVDVGVLTGEDPDGRCETESGMPLSAALARRLGCDAELVALIERDGSPLDMGRSKRCFTSRQRQALRARDRVCRYPGCTVSGRRCDGHHLRPWWLENGPTDLSNGALLCWYHHTRCHAGAFRIRKQDDGSLVFETRDGRVIGPPETAPVDPATGGSNRFRRGCRKRGLKIDAETPVAMSGGERCQFGHAVDVLTEMAAAGPAP
jgi:hypothetical protein